MGGKRNDYPTGGYLLGKTGKKAVSHPKGYRAGEGGKGGKKGHGKKSGRPEKGGGVQCDKGEIIQVNDEENGDNNNPDQVVSMSGVTLNDQKRTMRLSGAQVYELRCDLPKDWLEGHVRRAWEGFWNEYAANREKGAITERGQIIQQTLYQDMMARTIDLMHLGTQTAIFAPNTDAGKTLTMQATKNMEKIKMALLQIKRVEEGCGSAASSVKNAQEVSIKKNKDVRVDDWAMNRKVHPGRFLMTKAPKEVSSLVDIGMIATSAAQRMTQGNTKKLDTGSNFAVDGAGGDETAVVSYSSLLELRGDAEKWLQAYVCTHTPFWRREMDLLLDSDALVTAQKYMSPRADSEYMVMPIELLRRARVLYILRHTSAMEKHWKHLTVDGLQAIALTLTEAEIQHALEILCPKDRNPTKEVLQCRYAMEIHRDDQHHLSEKLEMLRKKAMERQGEIIKAEIGVRKAVEAVQQQQAKIRPKVGIPKK